MKKHASTESTSAARPIVPKATRLRLSNTRVVTGHIFFRIRRRLSQFALMHCLASQTTTSTRFDPCATTTFWKREDVCSTLRAGLQEKTTILRKTNGIGGLELLSRPALALSVLPQAVFAIAMMKTGAPSSFICEDRARVYDSRD